MDAFFKNVLSVGLALVFLLSTVSAGGFFYSFAAGNAFFSACGGAGCLVPLLPFSGVIYSGYVQNHRFGYLYSNTLAKEILVDYSLASVLYPKYSIYGELVDGFYPAFYNYNYFFPPIASHAKIYPLAEVRNSQAKADEAKRQSEALTNIKNSLNTESTLRTVQKTITVTPAAGGSAAVPSNQGWQQVTPTESFLEFAESRPNTLNFPASLAEINCGNVLGFVGTGIDTMANQSVTKSLYVTNNAGEDFFIDAVTVKENDSGFNAFGNVLDAKILGGDRGRVSVTVDAFGAENDSTESISVKAIGHFEGGKQCSVEQDFLVFVKGSGQTANLAPSFGFVFPIRIGTEGSAGFAEISLDNKSGSDLLVKISSSENAIVYPSVVVVPSHGIVSRTVSVNGAVDGELVYYSIFSGSRLLEEKYSKVFMKKNTPTPAIPPIDLQEGGLVFSSYSSRVMFLNGKADIEVALANTSHSAKQAVVKISNPKKGFAFTPLVLNIGAGETKYFNFFVSDNGVNESPVNALLTVEFDGKTVARNVVFEKEFPMQQAGQIAPVQSGGFASSAFALLAGNATAIGIAFAAFAAIAVLVLSIGFAAQSRGTEAWVTSKPN